MRWIQHIPLLSRLLPLVVALSSFIVVAFWTPRQRCRSTRPAATKMPASTQNGRLCDYVRVARPLLYSSESSSGDSATRRGRESLTKSSSKSKPARRASWEERYRQLQHYRSIHGHCNVPQSQKPLGPWVNRQRIEHARFLRHSNGNSGNSSNGTDDASCQSSSSSMTLERKERLDAIDFIWDATEYTWDKHYNELRDFREREGHCVVPRSFGALGAWVEKQRSEYKKYQRISMGTENYDDSHSHSDNHNSASNHKSIDEKTSILTKERIRKLNDIGFVWNVREMQFEQKLAELRAFRKMNGHIDPRFMNGRLALWVRRCEQQYKRYLQMSNGTIASQHVLRNDGGDNQDKNVAVTDAVGILSESRRLALESVGFSKAMLDEPRARSTGSRRATWEERYEELLSFQQRYGHCVVPKNYGPLGSWVRAQRHLMKERGTLGSSSSEGATSLLPQDKVDKLDRLGFVWDVHQWQWNQTFHELLQYKAKHNDTNVPMRYGGLGLWVFNQRAHYNSYRKGKPSHMTSERYQLLQSIGFEFDLGRKLLSAADQRWQSRLHELRDYKEKWGTFHVQKSQHPSLYNWCQNQKASYRAKMRGKKSSLKEKREDALREIGFLDGL